MDREGFKRRLSSCGFDEDTVVETAGTIVVPLRVTDEDASSELPVLCGGDDDELELSDPIARGGIGLVFSARQRALRREVAVKCAVPGSRDRHELGAELVREARITGALEHPNIVPVHALGRSANGEVLLVMKKIEGTSWADLLRARPSPDHDLDRHLEIFMEVCQAAHFAHSRGVIHRDLKPENVMVGSFGEIYVLDWGLAVAIHDRSIAGALRASDLKSIAGTPQYMAPEMTVPDGLVDERTDTFLLGATLHAILTGRGPHRGLGVFETLYHAHLCEPVSLPEDAPRELVDICTRALSREPADRFESAEQLRLAVAEFRRHTTARSLCLQARQHLKVLQHLITAEQIDDLAAHRAFSACRFGFTAAADVWPGSLDASWGRNDALHAMIEYEVARRHLDAARVLFEELQTPPPALDAKLRALSDELAAEADRQARGERAVRDIDFSANRRSRVVLYTVCALAWAGFGITTGALLRAGIRTPSYLELALANLSLIVVIVVVWRWMAARRRLVRADVAVLETGAVLLVGAALCWLAAWYAEMPLSVGLATAQTMVGVGGWGLLSFFDRRLRMGPAILIAGFPAVLLLDRWAFDLNGMFVGIGVLWTALRWQAVGGRQPHDRNS